MESPFSKAGIGLSLLALAAHLIAEFSWQSHDGLTLVISPYLAGILSLFVDSNSQSVSLGYDANTASISEEFAINTTIVSALTLAISGIILSMISVYKKENPIYSASCFGFCCCVFTFYNIHTALYLLIFSLIVVLFFKGYQ